MSASERNFHDFQLGDSVYELADGLVPEMARTMGYELAADPEEANLQGLVKHIGPAKWLQDNIGLVQERLNTVDDANAVAADWVDRSGVLLPTDRSFARPELAVPGKIDAAFVAGGVARWMLRRANHLTGIAIRGQEVGQVFLPVGMREMKPSEHSLVARWAEQYGANPTERDFAKAVIAPMLGAVGLKTEVLESINTVDGDRIMRGFAAWTNVTEGSVLAVGNAPSAVQTAGQFRTAARAVVPGFDDSGEQLFMSSDTIQLARQGEGAATHQNPLTALGQIARDALYLQRNNDR